MAGEIRSEWNAFDGAREVTEGWALEVCATTKLFRTRPPDTMIATVLQGAQKTRGLILRIITPELSLNRHGLERRSGVRSMVGRTGWAIVGAIIGTLGLSGLTVQAQARSSSSIGVSLVYPQPAAGLDPLLLRMHN